jgi:DNA-directed RNA polymerase specialized sigma24 family protein
MPNIIALPRPTGEKGPRPTRLTEAAARESFTELYAVHALLVAETAAKALHPSFHHLIDDVTQNVWLSVWQHLLGGHEVHHPKGFLAARTRSLALDCQSAEADQLNLIGAAS